MKFIKYFCLIPLFLLVGRTLLANDSTAPITSPPQKAACCTAEPAPKKEACCEAMATAAFSKDSIYQLDASFTTDSNRPFLIGELRDRPVVLAMFFATCGYACPLIVADMQAIRAKLPVEIRNRAAFVLISFDVARDSPASLANYRQQRSLDAQWTLLHGTDDAVREIAALLGVKFKRETDGAFSHSNLITVLNAQGEIVHQRVGLQGGLDETAAAVR